MSKQNTQRGRRGAGPLLLWLRQSCPPPEGDAGLRSEKIHTLCIAPPKYLAPPSGELAAKLTERAAPRRQRHSSEYASQNALTSAHRVKIPMVLRFINIHLFIIRYFISVPAGLLFLRVFHPQQDQVAQHQQKPNECHRQAQPNHVKLRELVEQDAPQQKRHTEEHPLQPHHSMFDFHRDQLLFYSSAYITFERANL